MRMQAAPEDFGESPGMPDCTLRAIAQQEIRLTYIPPIF
jgi:hypothetical protein